MSKGEKAVIGLLVIGFVATNFVIASAVHPLTKTVYVPKVEVVTPTASPSATVIPRVGRSAAATQSVVTAPKK